MILKEIELNGFKSFKEKTKLVFDTDIVAIVGPNGAGKSNVVDAIKWLLGEQSNKDIRTTDTSALIFASPDEKERLDLCSVAVTLENPKQIEHWRPGTYRVEKRYYRDEEAEYLINGEKVRLKDVRALLGGVGISLDNLSIVSQGEIGSFLSLVPTDRRLVFEEVAQLGHFKANKRRILNDLDNTGRNLERLDDNLVDRRSRLTQLGEQADIAKKHASFSDELQYCRGNLLAVDLIHCDRNRNRHERKIEENRVALKETEQEIVNCAKGEAKAENDLDELRSAREEALLAAEQYKNKVDAKRHGLEKSELAIGHRRESLTAKAAAVEEKKRQKILISEEITSANSRIKDLATKGEVAEREEAETREAHVKRVEDLSRTNEELGVLEEAWELSKNELEKRSREYTETELILKSLRESASSLEKSMADLFTKHDAVQEELEGLRVDLGSLSNEIGKIAAEKKSASAERERFEKELDTLRARQSEFLKDESSAQGELAGLEKLERERSGLGSGAKAVLDERDAKGGFKGIIGTLSDLISVKAGYEFALESVIGERLRYLVAETKADAIAAIDWVKETEAGQVSVIPLDEIEPYSPRALPAGLEKEGGLILRAIEALEFDPRLEPAVRYAVGDALLVTSLSAGMELRNKYGLRQKMATPDGDLIYPQGVLRGGRARQASAGLLVRKARIEKLNEDISLIKKEREQVALKTLDADRKAKEQAVIYAKADIAAADAASRKAEVEGRMRNAESNRAEVESHIADLEGRSKEEVRNSTKLRDELTALKKEIDELAAELKTGKARMAALKDEIDASNTELHSERTRLERYAILLSSYAEEIRRLEGEIKHRDDELARIDEEIAKAESDMRDFEKTIVSLETERDELIAEIERLEADFPLVAAREKELAGQIEDKRSDIEKSKLYGEELQRKRDEIEEDIHRSEVKLAALESERNSLAAELSNHFPKVFADLESGNLEAKELGAKGALGQKIAELEAAIADLGEINYLAITEFERVKEEITFKEKQREDLVQARTELEKNLAEVERKSRQVFMEVFDKTNGYFDEVWRRLFPGGQASVSLTDPSDPLESGIDIRARFPGKKEVDIIQFSGGEKAIVAIALLFALLKVKPSTCTLLDEVEAALDDVNVEKFLSLVTDFMPERQFIVITHNKGTMEFAQRLYGITMRRDGISRVVSVNLKEWDDTVLGDRVGKGLAESGTQVKNLPKPKPN